MNRFVHVVALAATLCVGLIAVPVMVSAAPGTTPKTSSAPAPAAGSDVERPYVYQARGNGAPMSTTAQYEIGFGTRATRFFGTQGVEQGLRLRFQPWRFINVAGFGGLLVAPNGDVSGAGAVDVTARALRQSRHYLDLHLGAGYLYDYRGRHVLRARAALGRHFGHLDLQLGTTVEVPLSGERDEADVMINVAASYRVTRQFRAGVEVGVEDLEGFWEPEESEGGAKVLFGPTVHFRIGRHFELRLNVSAVYAHLANQPGPAAAGAPRWGVMSRCVLGYTFRE